MQQTNLFYFSFQEPFFSSRDHNPTVDGKNSFQWREGGYWYCACESRDRTDIKHHRALSFSQIPLRAPPLN